jgi:hypothetical protein
MRYLSEAFWAKVEVPYLDAIPFNIVGLAAFALLGFGESAFWPLAQHYLNEGSTDTSPEEIRAKIRQLENDLKRIGITRTLRDSKEGTLRILQQRLTNLNRRGESNAEIESDLGRVEAQVDLALESATMQGQAEVISANIELTSHLLDSSSFGDLSATVDAMDQTFAEPKKSTTGAPPPADTSTSSSSSGEKTPS